MKTAKTLPVLRMRYDDAAQTWLYLTPSHGQIVKAERATAPTGGVLTGCPGLDFAMLYRHRPLWDVVAIVLLVGAGVSSATTVVPACRRLARHARRLSRRAPPVPGSRPQEVGRDPARESSGPGC
jgi:hypothetical protein